MPKRKSGRFLSVSTAADRTRDKDEEEDEPEEDEYEDTEEEREGSDDEEFEVNEDGRSIEKTAHRTHTSKRRKVKASKRSSSRSPSPVPSRSPSPPPVARTLSRPRLKFKVLKGKTVVEVVVDYVKDPLGLAPDWTLNYLPSMAPDQGPFRDNKDAQNTLRDELKTKLNQVQAAEYGSDFMPQWRYRSIVLASLDTHAIGPFEPFKTGVPTLQLPQASPLGRSSCFIFTTGGIKQNLTYDPSYFKALNVTDDDLSDLYGDRRPANYTDIVASADVAYRDLCYHHGKAVLDADADADERNQDWLDAYAGAMEAAKKDDCKFKEEEVGAAIYSYPDFPSFLLLTRYKNGRFAESKGSLAHAIEHDDDIDARLVEKWTSWAEKLREEAPKLSWAEAVERLTDPDANTMFRSEPKEQRGYANEWVDGFA
ncbi:hypothetical protein JCM10207_001991, partial [Rhodosporidiobolus poonsookiae]